MDDLSSCLGTCTIEEGGFMTIEGSGSMSASDSGWRRINEFDKEALYYLPQVGRVLIAFRATLKTVPVLQVDGVRCNLLLSGGLGALHRPYSRRPHDCEIYLEQLWS